MQVGVKLFARLRDIAGTAELSRDVLPGGTAGSLWASLVRQYPDLAAYSSSISMAVNAEHARPDTVLREGDEVAFLPPVSGGCTTR